MVDEIQVVLEQDLLRLQMDESREALAQKLERLEEKVTETVESATASVVEATASVMETVQNASVAVSETVDTVSDAVQGTVETVRTSVDSMKDAFDWKQQFENHPLLSFAGAVAAGYVGGKLLPVSSAPLAPARIADAEPRTHVQRNDADSLREPFRHSEQFENADGFVHASGALPRIPLDSFSTNSGSQRSVDPAAQSFGPELAKLQGLVIGTVLGSLRDLILKEVPHSIRLPLSVIIDDVTAKIGGTCISSTLAPPSTHTER